MFSSLILFVPDVVFLFQLKLICVGDFVLMSSGGNNPMSINNLLNPQGNSPTHSPGPSGPPGPPGPPGGGTFHNPVTQESSRDESSNNNNSETNNRSNIWVELGDSLRNITNSEIAVREARGDRTSITVSQISHRILIPERGNITLYCRSNNIRASGDLILHSFVNPSKNIHIDRIRNFRPL